MNEPLSFEKKAAERNFVEIVTARDGASNPPAVISPPSREEELPTQASVGGEMERTKRPSNAPAGRFRPAGGGMTPSS